MNTAFPYPYAAPARRVSSLDAMMAKSDPTMIAVFAFFAIAETLVLMNTQYVPAWCALGAAVATVWVFLHEKRRRQSAFKEDLNPSYVLLNAVSTMFVGIAAPRPLLTNAFHVNYSGWHPEMFVLISAVCGIFGFGIIHGLYIAINGELPKLMGDVAGALIGFIRKFLPAPPPPPPSPGPPGGNIPGL